MSLRTILKCLSVKSVASFLSALSVTVIAILLQKGLNLEIEMALLLQMMRSIHASGRSFSCGEIPVERDYN